MGYELNVGNECDEAQTKLLLDGSDRLLPPTATAAPERKSVQNGGDQQTAEIKSTFGALKKLREDLRGDFSSISLLFVLYWLQGIPLGLIGAIPLLLQDKHVSLKQQAVFSFAYYPYSAKLLWAPIVDAVYWKKMGRRKSWMVPCQYLIGIALLLISFNVPLIMGEANGSEGPKVTMLMLIFLPLNFLAATQDIAVDGWALTMLSRKNVGYASTCNAVGQTVGIFFGNVMFLLLQSANFSNHFRSADNQQDYGLVDLSSFTFFCGCIFIVVTTLVLVFKKEVDHSIEKPKIDLEKEMSVTKNADKEPEMHLGVVETYSVLWKIVTLKPMFWMLIILLTGKLGFAATDGLTGFKLIGMGLAKEVYASFGLFTMPLHVLLPMAIGKWTAGPKPLNIFLMAYPYRLVIGVVYAGLMWWSSLEFAAGTFGTFMKFVWIVAFMFYQAGSYAMFVSMMAFQAQISDPRVGGTYMTMLNTINNLGGIYPSTVVLSITEWFTFKNCYQNGTDVSLYSCGTKTFEEQCTLDGDSCLTFIDGYYIAVAACTAFGIFWYAFLFSKLKNLQRVPRDEWRVIKKE